ncbi:MAG TPA: ATP-binding protein [Chloroflexota bacterium]|nr:ATP-binding protein [Chloroflexota bacterium]HZU06251.1 ATP-binding protein [Chloroflexota bacterium]
MTDRRLIGAEGARLLAAVACGVALCDATGAIVDANPAAEELLGFPLARLLGKRPEALWPVIRPDGVPLVAGDDGAGAARDELALHRCTMTVLRADGSQRWLQMDRLPLPAPPGGGELLVYTFVDITARKGLEAQLQQAQRLEAVGRLAGGVAHDFNNLLTVILGNSELLADRLAADDPRRSFVEEIRDAADGAAALVRQLLAFSRQQVLAPEVLDLNALLAEMRELLQRLAGERVALSIAPGAALGHVQADRSQLQQVILNLVVNARDAMPRGGTLTIETDNFEADATYTARRVPVPPGHYVMLAVGDTGHGMDAATQARIFEPFFTTKEHGKGTGLGLATVYGIVKQSGGYVWVYSEPGQGSTFKVYLPRVDAPATPPAPRAAPAVRLEGTETVLVVDDEDAVRSLVRAVLEARGYTVLVASGGDEALQVSERHPGAIDLLVTDVVMPGMDGRELVRRLRLTRPDLRVLYASGYTAHTMTRHGVLEPQMVLLQKPFTTEALARKVREALDAPPGPRLLSPTAGPSGRTASAGAPAALSPREWCDRILTSLRRRMAQGPGVPYLQMVLTYFIEMDPAPDAFGDLLHEASADARPRMAAAARVLQRAWAQGYVEAAATAPPSLQQTLRTLGGLVDEAGGRGAYLGVTPGRAQLQVFGEAGRLDLGWLELSQQVAARTVLRGQGPAADPTATERFETRLRLIGAELDERPLQWYELVATPRLIVVEGSAGYYHEYGLQEIAAGLARAVDGRRPGAGARGEG